MSTSSPQIVVVGKGRIPEVLEIWLCELALPHEPAKVVALLLRIVLMHLILLLIVIVIITPLRRAEGLVKEAIQWPALLALMESDKLPDAR